MKVERITLPRELRRYRCGGRDKCREEGRCRMCERPATVRPLTRHHLVPQVWFSRRSFVVVGSTGTYRLPKHRVRDVDSNIVSLCAPCHALVEHDAPRAGCCVAASRRARRRSS